MTGVWSSSNTMLIPEVPLRDTNVGAWHVSAPRTFGPIVLHRKNLMRFYVAYYLIVH